MQKRGCMSLSMRLNASVGEAKVFVRVINKEIKTEDRVTFLVDEELNV